MTENLEQLAQVLIVALGMPGERWEDTHGGGDISEIVKAFVKAAGTNLLPNSEKALIYDDETHHCETMHIVFRSKESPSYFYAVYDDLSFGAWYCDSDIRYES